MGQGDVKTGKIATLNLQKGQAADHDMEASLAMPFDS